MAVSLRTMPAGAAPPGLTVRCASKSSHKTRLSVTLQRVRGEAEVAVVDPPPARGRLTNAGERLHDFAPSFTAAATAALKVMSRFACAKAT